MTAPPGSATAAGFPRTRCASRRWAASMNSTARSAWWCRGGLPIAGAQDCLIEIQHDLFDLGGELAIPGNAADRCGARGVAGDAGRAVQCGTAAAEGIRAAGRRRSRLGLSRGTRDLPPRRAALLGAVAHRGGGPPALHYLNRLSDLLFVLARVLARAHSGGEPLWQRGRGKGSDPDSSGQQRP